MNTPAPAPSKAHMQSLIDTSIIPNPYKPVVGDVYGREPTTLSDGLPIRVAIVDLGGSYDDDHMQILVDARDDEIDSLPLYLASIPGIAPIGRVRTEAPTPEVEGDRPRGTIGPRLRIAQALAHLERYHFTDGDHHKAWLVDQALRALMGPEGYAAWRKHEEGAGADPRDLEGIAP